jgi:DNA-directed RNA polymerase subunit N (RpoN/RPB10)
MIIPVKCFTCGMVIADKYRYYQAEVRKRKLAKNIGADTNNIDKVLHLFKVNNIIVGHTPQSMQFGLHINATCGDRVWRVDTASSEAFDRFDQTYVISGKRLESRKLQYLVIENDKEVTKSNNQTVVNLLKKMKKD